MLEKPSLIRRIAIGKLLGLFFGLIGFLIIPIYSPDEGLMFRFAFLLWYTTLGAIVGMFGVMTYHPVLKLPMPWWFRSGLMGGWMNFLLVLFIYDKLAALIADYLGTNAISPWWMVLEGVLIGLVCGYFATRLGGEGKETVGR